MIVSDSMLPMISPLKARSPEFEMPEVRFSPLADQQVRAAVRLAKKEVGWLGLVEEMPYGYLITEIFIPKQKVTSVTTDIDETAVAELALQLMDAGRDPSKLRYWGHSHVNMDVTPSIPDEMQIEEYLESCDWFIRSIHNKRGDCKMDVYDRRVGLIYQCVNTSVALSAKIVEQIDRKLRKNVTEMRYLYGGRNRQGKRHSTTVAGKPNIRARQRKRDSKRKAR